MRNHELHRDSREQTRRPGLGSWRVRLGIGVTLATLGLAPTLALAQDSGGEGVAARRQSAASGNSGLAAPESTQIDRLLAGAPAENVALAAGSWQVSPTGAFQYSIPIEVPAGRRGVAPRLALTYDAQLGNGMLGVGWSVTGIPAIVRIPHAQGVRFDGADQFAVAPQGHGTPATPATRLIAVGGSKYHTARETWAEYEAQGICGVGPCTFRMRDGKGGTYIFGYATASQLWERDSGRGQSSRGIQAWGLTQYIDQHGNAYQITYRRDFAMLYPETFEWGCGAMSVPSQPGWVPPPVPSELPPTTNIVPGDPTTIGTQPVPPPPGFPGQVVSPTSPDLLPMVPALAPTVNLGQPSSAGTITITLPVGSPSPSPSPSPSVSPSPPPLPACASRRVASFVYGPRGDVTALPERYAEILTAIRISSGGQRVRSYNLTYSPSTVTGRSLLRRLEQRGSDELSATALPALTFDYGMTATRASSTVTSLDGRDGPVDGSGDPRAEVQTLAGDFNGDGFDDIVRVAQSSAGRWVELSRGAAGGLGAPSIAFEDSAKSYEDWRATAADVNADGRRDLVLWLAKGTGGRLEVAAGTDSGLGAPVAQLAGPIDQFVRDVAEGPEYWRLLAGDVSGDQVADLVLVNLMTRDVATLVGDNLSRFTIRRSSFGSANISRKLEPLLQDMNGDGRADLILTFSNDRLLYLLSFAGKPDGLAAGHLVWLAPSAARGYAPYQALGGDLNGDGFGDLTIAYTGNTVSPSQVSAGRALRPFGRDVRTYYGAPRPGVANPLGMLFAAPRDQFTDANAFPSSTPTSKMATWRHHSADVNGDGLADLIMVYAGQHGVHVQSALADVRGELGAISTLHLTGALPTGAIAPDGDVLTHKWESQIADLDGDGLDDVVLSYSGPSGSFVRMLRGRPSGLDSALTVVMGSATDVEAEAADGDDARRADSVVLLTPDINGDGKPDLVLSSFTRLRVALSVPGPSDVMTQVLNGYGASYTVTQDAAPRVACAVRPASASCAASASSPGVPNRSPRPLTTRVDTSNGRGVSTGQSYAYSNGRFYPGFLELSAVSSRTFRADLGFEWSETSDLTTMATTRTSFRLDAPFERRVSQIELTAPTAPGAATRATHRRVLPTYAVAPVRWAGVAEVRLTDRSTRTWEAGLAAAVIDEHLEYDSWGATTLSRRCADGRCLDTARVYDHDATRWVLGRVRNVLVRPQGSNQVVSWQRHSYGARDLLQRTEQLLCADATSCPCAASETACTATGLARWVATVQNVSYDLNGLPLSTTDALGRTTTTSYDPVFGAYPASVTRRIGSGASLRVLTSTTTYDAVGRVDVETDVNGGRTNHDPDMHGRRVKLSGPGGTLETWSFINSGNPALQMVRHERASHLDPATGLPVMRFDQSYYDGLGTIYSHYQEIPGSYSVRKREDLYAGGQHVVRSSAPYRVLDGALGLRWTEIAYDVLGRPTSTTRKRQEANGSLTTLGVTDRLSRSGNELVLEENSSLVDGAGVLTESNRWRTTRRQHDSLGRMSAVIDAAGATTTYGYDDADRTVRVSGPFTAAEAAAPPQVITVGYDTLGRLAWRQDQATGRLTMEYDDVGNLLASVDALNRRVSVSYDELGRPVTRMAPDASGTLIPVAIHGYDDPAVPNGLGRQTSVTYPVGQQRATAYDVRGNLLGRTSTVSGLTGTQGESFSYDLVDRVLTRSFPDGVIQSNRYIRGGDLDQVSLGGTVWATWTGFSAYGSPLKRTLNVPGIDTTYRYDGDGLMASLESRKTVPTTALLAAQWYQYGFDARGNVRSLQDQRGTLAFALTAVDGNDSWSYGYDALDRLISASTGAGVASPMAYDARGNITQLGANLVHSYLPSQIVSRTFTTTGGGCLPGFACPLLVQYAPNFTATVNAVGQVTSKVRASGDRFDYVHDSDGQLTRVLRNTGVVAEFAYDHAGQRVRKVSYLPGNLVVTTFYIGDAYEVRKTSLSASALSITKTISAGGRGVLGTVTTGTIANQPATSVWTDARQPLAMSGDTTNGVPAGTVFFLGNLLGTTSVVVDATGAEVSRAIHAPYGELLRARSSGHDGVTRRFTGHTLDDETGLVYMGARHYDPELARFLSADSLIPGGGVDPQGLNRHAYVVGNPIRYVDPDGHIPQQNLGTKQDPWLVTDDNGKELMHPNGKTMREVFYDLRREPEKSLFWETIKESCSIKFTITNKLSEAVSFKDGFDLKGESVSLSSKEYEAGALSVTTSAGNKGSHPVVGLEVAVKRGIEVGSLKGEVGVGYGIQAEATSLTSATLEHSVKLKGGLNVTEGLKVGVEVKFKLGQTKYEGPEVGRYLNTDPVDDVRIHSYRGVFGLDD